MTIAKYIFFSILTVVGLCNKIVGNDHLPEVPFGTPYQARYHADFPTFNTTGVPISTGMSISADRRSTESEFVKLKIGLSTSVIDGRRLFVGYKLGCELPMLFPKDEVELAYFYSGPFGICLYCEPLFLSMWELSRNQSITVGDLLVRFKTGIVLFNENVFDLYNIEQHESLGASLGTEMSGSLYKRSRWVSRFQYMTNFNHAVWCCVWGWNVEF
jgi:hypothetical protein